jgi:hypothetical protein
MFNAVVLTKAYAFTWDYIQLIDAQGLNHRPVH